MALALRDLLQANGITTYMTRTTDTYVGLSARADYANSKGADRFASIHANAGGGTGIETYCMEGATSSSTGWKMASAIQDQMLAVWPLPNRGVKTANYAVLRETSMAATLSELAFIDKCSPDADYLGSDAHRAEAACAHLKAITGHLGLSGACSTSASTQGTAKGAVFEEKGSGTDDMSTRLPGAKVTVKESGATADATGAEALFTFDLEAGSYTLEASLDGYETSSVACVVTANETKWCSIGLTKAVPPANEDAGPEDAGGSEQDAGIDVDLSGSDAGLDVEAEEAGTSSVAPDFWTQDDEGGCGCRTASSRRSGWAGGWALLGLALFVLRRKRSRGIAGVAVGMIVLGCNQPSTHSEPERATFQPVGTTPDPDESGPRLVSPHRLLGPGYLLPAMSPDGEWVALTRPGLDRLWVASVSDGSLGELSRASRSGYLPVWSPDSAAIAHRDGTGVPSVFVDLQARRTASFLTESVVSTRQTDDDHIVVHAGGRDRVVDEGKDKYFGPVVSQDGTWVAYTGITLGIHAYHVRRGVTVQLGQGTHPSLSADGRWLAYEKTDDDGERLIAGDLYVCDLEDPDYPVFNLTGTPQVIERTPTLSSDGRRIAYTTADGLYVATVER